ncbi:hypothetical protein BHE74_00055892 [Ensete ventricosum]|uniref:Uncharacterized protein n=1 Tax=Ensete ventricosum TaxID=4639 RepID=A0A444DXT6_ENSVE|nr:hypothetical protein B296_00051675 [Ensete ventricosum]RWW02950.1 hypothetical protein GW17_00033933 [Ensete ventricosum]RWW38839.1 hypothetical protein BHE74_00055892 [Ensete ventricosum]
MITSARSPSGQMFRGATQVYATPTHLHYPLQSLTGPPIRGATDRAKSHAGVTMTGSSGSGKVVCVTGASGYIATWLVKLLLQRGYTVRASVRDPGEIHLIAQPPHPFSSTMFSDPANAHDDCVSANSEVMGKLSIAVPYKD